MKKLYFLAITVIWIVTVHAQSGPLERFTHSYFRSDPFASEFSSFVTHLMKDPDIVDKTVSPKTDTSFFLFKGYYKNFNPFFFKPNKLEVVLTQDEIRYSESDPDIDTVYTYQLIATSDFTAAGFEEIKKEFARINRQTRKTFSSSNTQDLKDKDGKIVGGIHHYFTPFSLVAPLTIAWGKLQGADAYVLNIVLRMKSYYNRAGLPIPAQKP